MKSITALVIFMLTIFVIFFEAEAGIIHQEYDATSDEMLIKYNMEDGDTIWNICRAITIKQVGMDFIEKNIMVPNNITDPTKIDIETVLEFRIKKSNFKDSIAARAIGAKESLVTENKSAVKVANQDSPLIADKNRISSSNPDIPIPSKNIEMVSTDNELSVEGYKKINKDLQLSLEVASTEIKNLTKMIKAKDDYILALEIEKQKAEVIIKSKIEKVANPIVPEMAIERFNEKRRILFLVIFTTVGLILVYLVFVEIADARKYSQEEKNFSSRALERIAETFKLKSASSSSS